MNLERIEALIESCRQKEVLFVGDTVEDEYQYFEMLGKASKENILAVRALRWERFDGGVQAAANHARSFCRAVSVISSGNGTRKVRFVDETYLRKSFEVHYGFERVDTFADGSFDAVIVTDFGHGAIDKSMAEKLSARNEFLCICAQSNAANFGFNLITKYPWANYIVIDEPEARLAASDRESDIKDVMLKLAKGRCQKMIVTHGRFGATGWSKEEGFCHVPALTDRIVDTMGAGDAFFVVTSLVAKEGCIEDLLHVGNAAGAIKTQIVGHRQSVTKEALLEFIRQSTRS